MQVFPNCSKQIHKTLIEKLKSLHFTPLFLCTKDTLILYTDTEAKCQDYLTTQE